MIANAGENELHHCNSENICHFSLINLMSFDNQRKQNRIRFIGCEVRLTGEPGKAVCGKSGKHNR